MLMVGVRGFEPLIFKVVSLENIAISASCSQSTRSTSELQTDYNFGSLIVLLKDKVCQSRYLTHFFEIKEIYK